MVEKKVKQPIKPKMSIEKKEKKIKYEPKESKESSTRNNGVKK